MNYKINIECENDLNLDQSPEDEKSNRKEVFLYQHGCKLFDRPITPRSELFLKPQDSPGYNQLDQRLQDIYNKIDSEMQNSEREAQKIIEVQNTACSSLMQRRIKSQSNLRIKKLF